MASTGERVFMRRRRAAVAVLPLLFTGTYDSHTHLLVRDLVLSDESPHLNLRSTTAVAEGGRSVAMAQLTGAAVARAPCRPRRMDL